MEEEGVFPRHQYAYRKGLGTYDAMLDIVCVGQAALDREKEIVVVQIDFSTAFDCVNPSRLVYKWLDVGVGGAVCDVMASDIAYW